MNEISIIRGNHDGNLEPLLPENVKLLPATGTTLGEVGFFHGHQWLSPVLLKCRTLLMGHVHPVVAFRDPAGFKITRQIWIKANCRSDQLSRILLQKSRVKIEGTPKETLRKSYGIESKTSQLFIMPSFNEFLGGKPINESRQSGKAGTGRIVGPVLRSEAVDIDNSEIYLLDGTFLGTLNQLKHLS